MELDPYILHGASIEKVVSEAAKRGIDKEQVLSDFEHLKSIMIEQGFH